EKNVDRGGFAVGCYHCLALAAPPGPSAHTRASTRDSVVSLALRCEPVSFSRECPLRSLGDGRPTFGRCGGHSRAMACGLVPGALLSFRGRDVQLTPRLAGSFHERSYDSPRFGIHKASEQR